MSMQEPNDDPKSAPPLFASRRPNWALPSIDEVHPGLQLTGGASLTGEAAGRRQNCPKCGASRAMYCYDCVAALPGSGTPCVALPFNFSIITHRDEKDSKNTGVHASILCPGQVQLHDIDSFPEAIDPARTIVLFPSSDALSIDELEPCSIDRAIIIDSKWKKAKTLLNHPSLAGVRRVKLEGPIRSAFWRFHEKGVSDEGVCTIECMHALLRTLADKGKLPHPNSSSQQQPGQPGVQQPAVLISLQNSSEGRLQASDVSTQLPQVSPMPYADPHADPRGASNDVTAAVAVDGDGPAAAVSNDVTAAVAVDSEGAATVAVDSEGAAAVAVDGEGAAAVANSTGEAAKVAASSAETACTVPGDNAPCHVYDNLLFFFVQQHRYIQQQAALKLEVRKSSGFTVKPEVDVLQQSQRHKRQSVEIEQGKKKQKEGQKKKPRAG